MCHHLLVSARVCNSIYLCQCVCVRLREFTSPCCCLRACAHLQMRTYVDTSVGGTHVYLRPRKWGMRLLVYVHFRVGVCSRTAGYARASAWEFAHVRACTSPRIVLHRSARERFSTLTCGHNSVGVCAIMCCAHAIACCCAGVRTRSCEPECLRRYVRRCMSVLAFRLLVGRVVVRICVCAHHYLCACAHVCMHYLSTHSYLRMLVVLSTCLRSCSG